MALSPTLVSPILRLTDRFGLLLLVLWLGYRLLSATQTWHADMAGIYIAGHFFASGDMALVYPQPDVLLTDTPPEWKAFLAGLGTPDAPAYPFVYPPVWAALAAPFASLLGPELFLNVAVIVQFGLVFWSIRLAWEIAGRIMPWGRWAALSTLVLASASASYTALGLNQPQITLGFLILLAASALVKGRDMQAGILLAVVAAIKISPALLIVLPLALGRWRAVYAWCATLALIVVADLLIAGMALNHDFVTKARVLADYTVSARITYNITPLLLSAFGDPADIVRTIRAGGFTALTPLWAKAVSLAVLAALVLAAGVATRRQSEGSRILSLTAALSIIIAATGPFGWSHYYLVPTMLLPALLGPGFPRVAPVIFLATLPLISWPTIFLPSHVLAALLPLLAYLVLLAVFVMRSGENPEPPPLRPASP